MLITRLDGRSLEKTVSVLIEWTVAIRATVHVYMERKTTERI